MLLHTGTEVQAGAPAQPNRSSETGKKHGRRQKAQHPNPPVPRGRRDEGISSLTSFVTGFFSSMISPQSLFGS